MQQRHNAVLQLKTISIDTLTPDKKCTKGPRSSHPLLCTTKRTHRRPHRGAVLGQADAHGWTVSCCFILHCGLLKVVDTLHRCTRGPQVVRDGSMQECLGYYDQKRWWLVRVSLLMQKRVVWASLSGRGREVVDGNVSREDSSLVWRDRDA